MTRRKRWSIGIAAGLVTVVVGIIVGYGFPHELSAYCKAHPDSPDPECTTANGWGVAILWFGVLVVPWLVVVILGRTHREPASEPPPQPEQS